MIHIIIVLLTTACCFYFDDYNWLNKNIDLVPFIHSCISSLTTNLIVLYNPLLCVDYTNRKELIYIFVLLVGLGYSFYDIYHSIRKRNIEYFVHGTIMFVSCYLSLTSSENIGPMLNYAFLCETSTFFLHLRQLKKIWIDLAFVSTFVFYRLILLPYITFYYMRQNATLQCLSFCLFILNVFWFSLIVKKLKKLIV
jgi:hypothetical protein